MFCPTCSARRSGAWMNSCAISPRKLKSSFKMLVDNTSDVGRSGASLHSGKIRVWTRCHAKTGERYKPGAERVMAVDIVMRKRNIADVNSHGAQQTAGGTGMG